ncbi:MAG TPA: 4a-hydroxytetrahydrobiopterin dehydratase, partial [Coleofasciculaceae cyanobacterium]
NVTCSPGEVHHPEGFNVDSQVTVQLTTPDAGGITMNDVTLAQSIDTSELQSPASGKDFIPVH